MSALKLYGWDKFPIVVKQIEVMEASESELVAKLKLK